MSKMLWTVLTVTVIGASACSSPSTRVAAAPAAPAVNATPASQTAVEQQAIQVVKNWIDAVPKRDTAVIGQSLADDFVAILWDGTKRTKAEYLSEITSGKYAVETIALEDTQARVVGDAAVVTYYQYEKSKTEGVNSSSGSAWTDVLARRNGQWQVIAEHGSRFN